MLRRNSTGFCLRMSVPSTSIVPELGSTRRLIIFMVVVLPQPEGPTRTTVSPLFMSRERSPTAAGPPFWLKVLDTFLSEIATSDIRSPYVCGSRLLVREPRVIDGFYPLIVDSHVSQGDSINGRRGV